MEVDMVPGPGREVEEEKGLGELLVDDLVDGDVEGEGVGEREDSEIKDSDQGGEGMARGDKEELIVVVEKVVEFGKVEGVDGGQWEVSEETQKRDRVGMEQGDEDSVKGNEGKCSTGDGLGGWAGIKEKEVYSELDLSEEGEGEQSDPNEEMLVRKIMRVKDSSGHEEVVSGVEREEDEEIGEEEGWRGAVLESEEEDENEKEGGEEEEDEEDILGIVGETMQGEHSERNPGPSFEGSPILNSRRTLTHVARLGSSKVYYNDMFDGVDGEKSPTVGKEDKDSLLFTGKSRCPVLKEIGTPGGSPSKKAKRNDSTGRGTIEDELFEVSPELEVKGGMWIQWFLLDYPLMK
ncbi:hypothetical protein CBR_g47144 [Chara braunii]|uniref:Uncharacterized protein n=1 Tax=Chara braunii TaxID=69332 RepID=A0A388M1K8_CHABU|nr:hypothetical protein CBR_g47144 [Chara braunii]|eukprot:GBG88444.1 hypothetical protein CBR_g47144 [Chara braunii]